MEILFSNFSLLQSNTNNSETTLRIDNTTRKDTGTYTVTASNPYGKDSADIEVTVVSCPDAPEGPLNYIEITPETVTMIWMPPKDDGGSEIIGKLDYSPSLFRVRSFFR